MINIFYIKKGDYVRVIEYKRNIWGVIDHQIECIKRIENIYNESHGNRTFIFKDSTAWTFCKEGIARGSYDRKIEQILEIL